MANQVETRKTVGKTTWENRIVDANVTSDKETILAGDRSKADAITMGCSYASALNLQHTVRSEDGKYTSYHCG